MIIRRYGDQYHSVTLDFDPAALTEVGFRRDNEQQWEAGDFEAQYELVREESIISEGTDPVQDKAERMMLDALRDRFNEVYETLEEGQILSVQSERGKDHPRTRYDRTTKGDQDFTYTLDRPLKLGIWSRRA